MLNYAFTCSLLLHCHTGLVDFWFYRSALPPFYCAIRDTNPLRACGRSHLPAHATCLHTPALPARSYLPVTAHRYTSICHGFVAMRALVLLQDTCTHCCTIRQHHTHLLCLPAHILLALFTVLAILTGWSTPTTCPLPTTWVLSAFLRSGTACLRAGSCLHLHTCSAAWDHGHARTPPHFTAFPPAAAADAPTVYCRCGFKVSVRSRVLPRYCTPPAWLPALPAVPVYYRSLLRFTILPACHLHCSACHTTCC